MKNRNFNLKRYQVKVEKEKFIWLIVQKNKISKKIYCNTSNCTWYLKIMLNAHIMSKHYVKSKNLSDINLMEKLKKKKLNHKK